MRICLATQNAGKLAEFRRLLHGIDVRSAQGAQGVEVVSLSELGVATQVEETGETFAENARLKARAAAAATGLAALADDSGLAVDALGGAPGVHSARYAGEDATDSENSRALLDALDRLAAERGVSVERSARFVCALCLVHPDGSVWFETEGACEGALLTAPRGDNGFGYDPLFVPVGDERTFAEHEPAEKNAVSHRALAARKLAKFLRSTSI